MPNPTDGSRGRLLDAAEALLGEDADRSLSVRAVCSRAGVQLPKLYHFFESKQGLIDALVERGFDRFARLLDEIPSPSGTGAPAAIWDAHLAFAVEHPALFTLMTGHVRPGSPRDGDDIAGAATLRLLREEVRHRLPAPEVSLPPSARAPSSPSPEHRVRLRRTAVTSPSPVGRSRAGRSWPAAACCCSAPLC